MPSDAGVRRRPILVPRFSMTRGGVRADELGRDPAAPAAHHFRSRGDQRSPLLRPRLVLLLRPGGLAGRHHQRGSVRQHERHGRLRQLDDTKDGRGRRSAQLPLLAGPAARHRRGRSRSAVGGDPRALPADPVAGEGGGVSRWPRPRVARGVPPRRGGPPLLAPSRPRDPGLPPLQPAGKRLRSGDASRAALGRLELVLCARSLLGRPHPRSPGRSR
jgi:hypothetical protein